MINSGALPSGMQRIARILAGVTLCVLVCGCAGLGQTSPSQIAGGRPGWIDNPGDGVSASAGTHVRGRAAQEELAILRAREEYARRFGVTIQAAQTVSTTVANDRTSTVGTGVAHEEIKQTEVKARVKAKWVDPDSDVLWVWLVPNDQ